MAANFDYMCLGSKAQFFISQTQFSTFVALPSRSPGNPCQDVLLIFPTVSVWTT